MTTKRLPLKGEKTLADLAQQFDVHPNQITAWKAQLVAGAADIFGSGTQGQAAVLVVDLKLLHAKIGELALKNDFFGRCARQSRPAERKAMINRSHELALLRQAEVLNFSRSPLYY